MREAGTLAALVIMVLVIAVAIPQFRQWENVVNITRTRHLLRILTTRPNVWRQSLTYTLRLEHVANPL